MIAVILADTDDGLSGEVVQWIEDQIHPKMSEDELYETPPRTPAQQDLSDRDFYLLMFAIIRLEDRLRDFDMELLTGTTTTYAEVDDTIEE
jgi:hypothetical protein